MFQWPDANWAPLRSSTSSFIAFKHISFEGHAESDTTTTCSAVPAKIFRQFLHPPLGIEASLHSNTAAMYSHSGSQGS